MRRNAFQNLSIVGVENGSFQKGTTRRASLAVVLFKRLKSENIEITKIAVGDLDATEKLAEVLNEWKFVAIMLLAYLL